MLEEDPENRFTIHKALCVLFENCGILEHDMIIKNLKEQIKCLNNKNNNVLTGELSESQTIKARSDEKENQ